MFRFVLLLLIATSGAVARAEETPKEPESIRLYPRDQVHVTVQGEPDMTVDRQIDLAGEINLPLIGGVKVGGLTIAEAQLLIAKRYVEEDIFIRPEVVFTVVGYAPKEVTILGQIGRQGKVLFPADRTSLPLVDAIAQAGGLSRIAKGDALRITRRDAQGVEQNFIVNFDKMVEGRGAAGETFYLQPGDIVFVPERVF